MKADKKAPSGMDLKGLKNDFSAWILHRNRQFMRFYAENAPFRGRGGRTLGGIFHVIAEAEDQCLRMIAEMLAEKIDAARVFRIGVHADDDGDIVVLPDIQIFDGHVADALVVKKAALVRDAPCFQEAELRGKNRPPFRREPSAASAAVAGACPYAQLLAVDGNGNIALPRVAIHRGFRTGFKGELQPVQGDCVHFQMSEAIFERALTKPDELCAESVGHVKGSRCIHIAERRVIVGEPAGRLNIGCGAVAADGHLQGERGRTLLILRREGDGERIQPAAAQLDDAAGWVSV